MMRPTLIVVMALGAAACGGDSVAFEHRGTMWQDTRGLALYDDGAMGIAGMLDQTCEFETRWGGISADFDFTSDAEEVEDAHRQVALTRSGQGVHLLHAETWAVDEDIDLGQVWKAGLHDTGVAVLSGSGASCEVSWFDGMQDPATPVAPELCNDSSDLTVVRDDGTVFVATGDELWKVTPEAADVIAGGIDLVVHDPTTDALYTAVAGDTVVTTLELDGATRWERDLQASVRSLAPLGDRGAVSVVVESGSGGEIVALDGWTGEPVGSVETPQPADIVTSADGSVAAMVVVGAVYFYDVQEGSGKVRVGTAASEGGATPPPMAD